LFLYTNRVHTFKNIVQFAGVGLVAAMSCVTAVFAASAVVPGSIKIAPAQTAATITWSTASPSKSWFVYGTSLSYGSEYKTEAMVTNHTASLQNLVPNQTYYLHIKTDDGAGSVSEDRRATLYSTFYTSSSGEATQLQMRLLELQAQLQILKSQSSGQSTAGVARTLHQGMVGEDVRMLQKKLNANPLTQIAKTGPGSPGSETDYFGPATTIAVKKFQELHKATVLVPSGLSKATGVVGAATARELDLKLMTTSVPSSAAAASTEVLPAQAATPSVPSVAVSTSVSTSLPSPLFKFFTEDRVEVVEPSNVRSQPSITAPRLGTKGVGAAGMITQDPVVANGYTWWNVDFDSGVDGWMIENALTGTTH
jgi:peptidoglycan hydrolase-like protein with peptidoglycan-binding domain